MSQTVLITGASSGFGRDTALSLAASGHRVFAGVRDIGGRNAAAAASLRTEGVVPLALDVTSDGEVEQAVATVLAQTGGRIDVVINNAGIASLGISETFSSDQLREMLDVNVVGAHRMLRATLPAMRRQARGLVIVLGSIVGRLTFPFMGLYGASKFALEALTDGYRYDLAQAGIDMVLIQPSAYPTNIFTTMQTAADPARAASYGETAQMPAAMLQGFKTMLAGEGAPDPHDIAAAILGLVAAAPGSRPHRLVVGPSFGADAINAAVAPVQRAAVAALGLGALETAA